jgi:hypothetical protein
MNIPQLEILSQWVVGPELFPQADQYRDTELGLVTKWLDHD